MMNSVILLLVILPFSLCKVCRDNFYNCPQLRQLGYCSIPSYRTSCSYSCGLCVVPTVKIPLSTGPINADCKDKVPVLCAGYKKQNFCNLPDQYVQMKLWCPKTCNLCGSKPGVTNPPLKTTKNPFATRPPMPANCGLPKISATRIVSGTTAKPGSWPWQVYINIAGKFTCGGTLITPEWVITAAHCVDGFENQPSGFKIRAGEQTLNIAEGYEQNFLGKKVIKHSSYRATVVDSDIAMIKLDRPVILGPRVSTVCLPNAGDRLPAGTQCYITGWGKTGGKASTHNILQQAKLSIVDASSCNNHNQQGLQGKAPPITDNMICAGNKFNPQHGCGGDSGGPFVCRTGKSGAWVLHGAVSWGSADCKSATTYTMFARVAKFRKWIDSVLMNY